MVPNENNTLSLNIITDMRLAALNEDAPGRFLIRNGHRQAAYSFRPVSIPRQAYTPTCLQLVECAAMQMLCPHQPRDVASLGTAPCSQTR